MHFGVRFENAKPGIDKEIEVQSPHIFIILVKFGKDIWDIKL